MSKVPSGFTVSVIYVRAYRSVLHGGDETDGDGGAGAESVDDVHTLLIADGENDVSGVKGNACNVFGHRDHGSKGGL